MRKGMTFVSSLLALVTIGVTSSCSGSDSLGPGESSVVQLPVSTGSDTTTVPIPGPRTGSGPVVGVRISPASAVVEVGSAVYFWAAGDNAAGELVEKSHVSWVSSDPSIAAVSDSGTVRGVAVGSAHITATIDGHSASADVIVIAPPPPLTEFDLQVTVRGALPGVTDTTAAELVSGATVTLYRTTPDSSSMQPDELIGTRTTDPGGSVAFRSIAPGWFRVEITPPAGSPYHGRTVTFHPPLMPVVPILLFLPG